MTTDGGRHQMLLGLTIMHYSFRKAAKEHEHVHMHTRTCVTVIYCVCFFMVCYHSAKISYGAQEELDYSTRVCVRRVINGQSLNLYTKV